MNDCKRRGKKEKEEITDNAIANSMKMLMISSILMMNESGEADDNHCSNADIERPASKAMLKAKVMQKNRAMKTTLLKHKPLKQKIFSRKF